MKSILLAIGLALAIGGAANAAPLRVCATTPDLGALAREIGGDDVELTVFAKPGDDPHFLDARPSFISVLSRADVFIQTGLELEVGWAPLLLQGARNAKLQPGQPGFVDASAAIEPRDIPTAPIDRSHGDVHPLGNPHYLLDPRQGLKVSELLRDRFAALRPDLADRFQSRQIAFAQRLAQAESDWARRLAAASNTPVVVDHQLWSYFADRFGLRVVATLEPKPGVPPTTRHLIKVIEQMNADHVRLILSSPYFDERHAQFVAQRTGARIVRLAHQPGSRAGAEGYVGMIDYNVRAIAEALAPAP